MGKLRSARDAWRAGGHTELVRRTRVWLARRIYPGTLPPPRPKRRPSPRSAPPRDSASTVAYEQALAWFDRRRPVYDKLSDAVAPLVKSDAVVFDIGANIGYFTKVLGERVGLTGTVHLFEPVPNVARLCERTLADVPYTVHVHEFGLADADARLDIRIADDGNLGWNTIVAERATTTMETVEIEVRAFVSAGVEDVPDFIKIDVEGAEYRVLAGLLPALSTWSAQPPILCEIGWGTGHPQWPAELEMFAELAALGYRTTTLDGDPVDVATLTSTTDVLFLPS